jgi:hypothetical protein
LDNTNDWWSWKRESILPLRLEALKRLLDALLEVRPRSVPAKYTVTDKRNLERLSELHAFRLPLQFRGYDHNV